jgi:hypothetical protein
MIGIGEQPGRSHLCDATRIWLWSLTVWVVLCLAALAAGPWAAVGVAAGGGVILGSFAVHLALARFWLARKRPMLARAYLWVQWLVKWPSITLLLYGLIRTGAASPVWLCVGVAIVPTVATVVGLMTSGAMGANEKVTEGAG